MGTMLACRYETSRIPPVNMKHHYKKSEFSDYVEVRHAHGGWLGVGDRKRGIGRRRKGQECHMPPQEKRVQRQCGGEGRGEVDKIEG